MADGERIVASFQAHPYVRDLARNPLMLSAICLVNYFEGGQLPHDRAILYRLCVEGLLHHWDQRRGIHSVYSLTEKLQACREVALAMQADDRAEYVVDEVQAVFAAVLGDDDRAARLLEHIRYRTGLLLERRPGVFAFAHLTFQEYLAAQAVHEGNRLGITAEQLAREHADGRWNEVIALFCGLTPLPIAQAMIRLLIDQPDTIALTAYPKSWCEWYAGAVVGAEADGTEETAMSTTLPLPPGAVRPAQDDPTIWQVDDVLWAKLAPVLTIAKPRKKPGRPRAADRPIFNGLIWLARTGGQWQALPRQFGPKSTVHDRWQEWVEAGALKQAWALLLEEFDAEIGLDWEWQAADGCIVKAPLGKRGRTARRRRPAAAPLIGARVGPSATP